MGYHLTDILWSIIVIHREKKNIETIHKFSSNLLENIEDIPLEFSEAIDEKFWDLV